MRTPCPAELNLAAYALSAGPDDKIALAVLSPQGAERWSYGRLRHAVACAAGGLRAAGLGPGDRLMLRLGNGVDFPVAFLGAAWAGIVPVVTAAGLTAPEIARLADIAEPAAVLAAPGIAAPPRPYLAPDRLRGDPLPAPHPTAADAPAYIVFTSGTSGAPKAVVHAHRAVWARRSMWDGWYGLTPTDRVLHAGAVNWTYTLGAGLLDPWAAGATALVLADGTNPELLPLLAARHDATILAAVPGLFRRLLRGPLRMPRLRHALSAGERLPAGIRDGWRKATSTDIHEALGMSECSTFISGCPDRPAPEGTVGLPQPGRRIAILDDDGRVLAQPPDAPGPAEGRLAVHKDDPGLMLGYLDGGLPLTGDWFVTGDRVRWDGAITHLGRADDLLTTGGYRIAPQEIEAALEDVAGPCAAVSLPVGPETEVLALAHAGRATETAIAARAAEILAPYKRPRLYLAVADIPRTANGKLDRAALRATLEKR